jgi:small subunit ribosomal protein S8e
MFTSGRRVPSRGKRKHETGREAGEPHVAPLRKKKILTRGGNQKIRLLRCDVATVSNPRTGKAQKVKIERVVENKANLHFTRRNIITKGAVIQTELGNAIVTNRPGQDGSVDAVLLIAEE